MNREGYVGIDRNIKHSRMWPRGRRFSKLEAWIDLLLRARWKEGTVRYQGADILLERGELVTSTRQLASDWRWDRKTVLRTLESWVASGSIEYGERGRHGTRIFIVNYGTYNPRGNKKGAKGV